jgi:hypothetical protein
MRRFALAFVVVSFGAVSQPGPEKVVAALEMTANTYKAPPLASSCRRRKKRTAVDAGL